MTELETRINDLFDELVPAEGKADTVAGEIIRATCRLHYRNWNDGDHIGVGYGNETCNAAARYLMDIDDPYITKIIVDMWGMQSDTVYDAAIEVLLQMVISYLDAHPELRETKNETDMFSFRRPEDLEYDEEEDECW